ncbi:UDP-3-O-(3-hydroxymyristoyl)glucosamine N-acyltransferase [Salinisphaera sp. Q1T1-3]|uniref:UDP-3-O-(3-hydroxymyristoyl)glucosamine N-acyltransferase n=1 Tax=Salinisphaera sp. Q1T1-3 TaxID=2321229 RepID=UPI000E70D2B5|nr:UDP-3-O-(3-hydroxymyristoyl)glucosamine N-acyltransferase [Salinisphaera sp. Q1T1-3]RJS95332.1 UDP-3-O-(3-hydroxymyristoyl)glucosamine N-acyltransferase [Salinisphaera sp. Q1T1-3]
MSHATDPSNGWRLGTLAEAEGLSVTGDSDVRLTGACALAPGRPHGLVFAEKEAQREAVAATRASAAILPPALADAFAGPVIVTESPRLIFSRIARAFEPADPPPGIHPAAVVSPAATVAGDACVQAQAVIEAGAVIGARTVIGAGAIIGADTNIGVACRIGPRASVLANSRLGARVRVGAGAVIGERGFGLVPGPAGLEPVPQLGGVLIGDDVEIGANTTIDRGALDDTTIGAGVKIDNQVHIAHNCRIDGHTVIAGCTGIAGSTHIGAGCMIGGGVGIGDHVTIADGVTITAASQIPKNIEAPGVYSSTFRAMPAGTWRRRLALFRGLDRIEARLSRVEKNHRFAGDTDD